MLGVSALSWFVLASYKNLDLSNLWNFLKILPDVVTIDLILIGVFIKWVWRWKILQGWLVPFPDLNGTWQGYIHSNWVDPDTGEKPSSIVTILSIKQSFTKISCVLRTSEMTSYSYTEGFTIDDDKQIKQLVCSYTSRPRPSVKERSTTHDGTIVFNLIGTPVSKLKGRYWTDRETTGEITLTFREKKLLDEIPEDLPPHQVTNKNNKY